MLVKDEIDAIKRENIEGLYDLLKSHKTNVEITNILENLGYLPKSFNGQMFVDLINHPSNAVRLLAIKNLGKLKNPKYVPCLYSLATTDSVTDIRREAVSALGRMRSAESKELLINLLSDEDPKVVSQAIRGLLLYKGDRSIDEKLKPLVEHENETVSSLISKAYFKKQSVKTPTQPHNESYAFLQNVVVNADVRNVLAHVPNDSLHLTFTSPPYYNAKDYSIYPSYKAYLDFLEEVFSQTLEKTKEGRFLVVNTSPIIIPRVSRAHSSKRYPIPFDLHGILGKMGWEFIDDIVWMKPEASVKNRNGGFMQHRKPLGYKPNAVTEYLMVYRKVTPHLIDWNIKQYDKKTIEESKVLGEYEKTNVWQIDPVYNRSHLAVFPHELCRRVIEYYSFKGDLVFDPFGGSGTLAKSARVLGRKFFLTELDSKYYGYIKTSMKEKDLFADNDINFFSLDEFIKSK